MDSPSAHSASPPRQVALVTGASRGIGHAIAELLGSAGYAVAINYFRSREPAEALADQLRRAGGQAQAIQADVGRAADRGRLVGETVEAFGRLDVLVNNAGITSPGRKDLLEATEAGWDQVFDTNLKGPFFLAQQCARQMLAQPPLDADAVPPPTATRGYLINISSISAYAVSTNRADYCLAKAAMQMMTWLFADRLADDGVQVFEVCPGVIASDMTAPVRAKYDALIAEGLTPIRRWGTGDDVGRAVLALISGSFPFTTGERLNVDGGFHIRRL